MIYKNTFLTVVNDLGEYYNRKLGEVVIRVWFNYLSERLSTEEFILACEQALIKSQWMPTPEMLVEYAKGASNLQVQADWDKCLKKAANADFTQPSDLSELDEAARYALNAAGGFRQIAHCKPQDLPFVRKAFVEAYKDYLSKNTSAIANKKLLESA